MTPENVTVRMFNVGFGDCFLMRFKTDEGESSVLVDCGVHSASKSKIKLEEIVAKVLEELKGSGSEPSVDVVIGTHRHRDHVHGFGRTEWESLAVKEVWMPWTEHPTNPPAVKLREKQSASALRLVEITEANQALDGSWEPLNLLALNSLTNEKAMRTLHSGFKGSPKRWFLPTSPEDLPPPEEDRSTRFVTEALPGVVVHVLGPSRDEKVIRDMDPPEEEAFLRLALSGDAGDAIESRLPFLPYRWSDEDPGRSLAEFEAKFEHLDLSKTRARIVEAAEADPYIFAVALEQAVNGTSLMLLFEFGDAFLLFPGDAQWGTWDSVLNNSAARTLISKATFYKVGHHGSHNATPRKFVEEVIGNVEAAMVSVAPTSIPSFGNIPKGELLEALRSHVGMVIESNGKPPAGVKKADDQSWLEITLPA